MSKGNKKEGIPIEKFKIKVDKDNIILTCKSKRILKYLKDYDIVYAIFDDNGSLLISVNEIYISNGSLKSKDKERINVKRGESEQGGEVFDIYDSSYGFEKYDSDLYG